MPKPISAALALALAPIPALAASPLPVAPFTTPQASLDGPIALMVDAGSGRVLYSRSANRRFVPASITKIMTAFVAFELVDQRRLDLRQQFTVSPEISREWSGKGTSMFLQAGSQVTVQDLLRGIVTVSANDACVVLATGIAGSVPRFTEMMNAKARELGLRNSRFGTPNGWPDEGGTYVSAADLAVLGSALIDRHPDLYGRFFGHSEMTWDGRTQRNHNPLYGFVAGADGIKTGFTNEAGYGFVGSAMRHGRRVTMVVAGYDHGRERDEQARGFMEWAFSAWEQRKLFAAGQEITDVRVQGGDTHSVALAAPRDLFVTLPKGGNADYSLAVRYFGPLRAPISKGQRAGALVVSMPGEQPIELPLVATEAVARGGPFDRLLSGLAGLVGL